MPVRAQNAASFARASPTFDQNAESSVMRSSASPIGEIVRTSIISAPSSSTRSRKTSK